jgi:anti-sigma factor RsiW
VKLTKEELLALYQPVRSQSARQTECLTEEELASAAADELSQSELRRVAAHLVTCVDCAEEYRLVRPLNNWAQQVSVSAGEFVPAIATADIETTKPVKQSWWQGFQSILVLSRVTYAVAAGFAVGVLALGIWIVLLRGENQRIALRLDKEIAEREQAAASANHSLEETQQQLQEARRQVDEMRNSNQATQQQSQVAELRRSLDELSRPHVNVPIIELEPQGTRRGEAAARTLTIPSRPSIFALVLNITSEQVYSDYAVEITDRDQKLVWSARGLQKSPQNTFTLALPRRLLPAGQYRIKLYGVDKNRREIVEDYSVRVEYK